MEWRIRTGKRMNAADYKTTLSDAFKLERHLPGVMRQGMRAAGDNPFNGASIRTAPTAPRGLRGCAEFVRSRRRAINVISKERQHGA
jgi:hypothetical protein